MINDYYSILGLEKGATEKEIKRAYFRLIRQYSPETDPERFKEIRNAYEELKEHRDEQQISLPVPSDAEGQQVYQRVQQALNQRNYSMVMDLCETEAHYRENSEIFQYFLGIAQNRLGYTGKAVKTFEKLLKKAPEDPVLWREMALAYMERGFTKKAYPAFDKAYALGIRSDEFLFTYSICCEKNGKYAVGINILYGIITDQRKRGRDDIGIFIDAFSGWLALTLKSGKKLNDDFFERFIAFLNTYSIYLEDWAQDIVQFVLMLQTISIQNGFKQTDAFKEIHNILEQSLHSPESQEIIQDLKKTLDLTRLDQDPRLGNAVKMLNEACLLADEEYEDSTFIRFAILDSKLCALDEMPDILKEFDILEREYPEVFTNFQDFANQLRRGQKLNILKDKLLNDYTRLCNIYEGGNYYDKHPELFIREKVICDGYSETPYMREGKKIGRNDPCPCGSGKKYKHCCGR